MTRPITADALLQTCAWDSDHFGLPVQRIASPDLSGGELRELLGQARRDGVGLVYWAAHPGREVPADVLHDYRGTLVDHKATYRCCLSDCDPCESPTRTGAFEVVEFPRGAAPSGLVDLAVLAGARSRFCNDPRIPRSKFEGLYETWIKRSTLRELADVVLVATDGRSVENPAGMVTLSEASGEGSIGLIAVRQCFHGKGVGSLLMRAVHQWMAARGARRIDVVTQRENGPACRLYERFGYRLHELSDYYHFWPNDGR